MQKALAYYNEVLEQAKLTGDLKRSAICLKNIGLVYAHKGDLDTAVKYYEDSLKINREIGYKKGTLSLGHVSIDM